MINDTVFENTEEAFILKSNRELKRAHFLFTMIGKPWLVNAGTALTNISFKLHLPVQGLIRATVFDHFCGGVTEEECTPVVEKMFQKGVSSILDYSVEGKEDEEDFDAVMHKKLALIEHASKEEALPFEVIKPTGLGRFYIWQKVTEKEPLTSMEVAEWDRIKARIKTICQKAFDCDVALLIDGEESWMQDAADDLVDDMMALYNKKRAIIYNTVQCYRHDRMAYVKQLHARGKNERFFPGCKIVRGAYMEKENDRALQHGYPSPICASKQATDANYNAIMDYILENLDVFYLCVATHNETSTLKAMRYIENKGWDTQDAHIWFGQLYGMSDNLTFNLAAQGYNSFKILPFGPVRDVMPYLIRRAQENTSVAGQTGRELLLIKKEMKRRKLEA